MAIKRRTPSAADIEAFGDAASPVTTPRRETTPVTREQPRRAKPPVAQEWPSDLARTLLIRYPGPELPTLLAQLAALDERSQHVTAIRALRRGLDALAAEAGIDVRELP